MAKYISLIVGSAFQKFGALEVVHENSPSYAENNPRLVLSKNVNGVFLLSIGGDDLIGESSNEGDYGNYTDALVLDALTNKQAAAQLRELADYLDKQ